MNFYPYIKRVGDKLSIFKADGDFIYLDTQYCEFYIPMYYFDSTSQSRKFAEDFGDTIKTLGIFNVGIFKDGKLTDMKTLNIPTMITIYVSSSELREITLSNGENTQCKVIKYLKGAKIMGSRIFEDDEYAKKYLNYITGGNLPNIIPYSKLLEMWRMNQKLNGVNFGVSSLYLELILATMYRNPKNLSEKFSTIASKEGVGDYDYGTASIRQICQYTSTYTAVTYEDIDSMITTSLNRSRNGNNETESPVEQVIKF